MTTAPAKKPDPATEPATCAAAQRLRAIHWVMILLAAAAILLLLFMLPTRQWLRDVIRWTGDAGFWGILTFIAIYIILATLAFPITPMNLAAGLLFGVWTGFGAALSGSVGAAALSFLLSRHLLQSRFKRRLARNPRFEALVEGIEEEQWKMVILTRLNPVLPASLKNYSFGLTHIPWEVYIIGSAVALVPSTFLLAYLGSAGHVSVEAGHDWRPVEVVLYTLGGLAAVAATLTLAWIGRRKMAELEARHEQRHPHPPQG